MLIALLALAAHAQDVPVAAEAPALVPPATPTEDPVKLRVSILPNVGLNAAGDAHVDGVSVGFVSRAASVKGVDGEAFLSWVDGDVNGAQGSGFGAWTSGSVHGAQGAGFVSVTGGDVRGAQGSGFVNVAGANVNGAQGSGFVNIANGDVRGVQGTGFVNIANGDIKGVQGSGFVNVATGEESKGVQGSGGLNVARNIEGVQAAPMNVAESVDGVQAGVLNIGGDVDGLQIGVVNVAKTSKVSIAPINLIGDGLHRLDIWTSDSAVGSAAIKFGSRHVYTLIGGGWVDLDDSWVTFGFGMGVHLPRGPLWLEIDDSVWGVADGHALAPGVHNKLRAQVGFDLAKHLSPFAGVSFNTWTGDGSVTPRAVGLPSRRDLDGRFVSWPGVHAGVSF